MGWIPEPIAELKQISDRLRRRSLADIAAKGIDQDTAERIGQLGRWYPWMPAGVSVALARAGMAPLSPEVQQIASDVATSVARNSPMGFNQPGDRVRADTVTPERGENAVERVRRRAREMAVAQAQRELDDIRSQGGVFARAFEGMTAEEYAARPRGGGGFGGLLGTAKSLHDTTSMGGMLRRGTARPRSAAAGLARDNPVTDNVLEPLARHTITGENPVARGTRAVVRTGTAALETPQQFAQAQYRTGMENIREHGVLRGSLWENNPFNPEQTFRVASQTDVGQMITHAIAGEDIDTGSGWFVNPDSGLGQSRRRYQTRFGGTYGNGQVRTIGRDFADVFFEPGSREFNIVSGLGDAAVAIASDRMTSDAILAARAAGAFRTADVVSTATTPAGRLSENVLGLIRGVRPAYSPAKVDAWIGANRTTFERIADTTSISKLDSMFDRKLDPALLRRLVDETDPDEVTRILRGELGLSITDVPKTGPLHALGFNVKDAVPPRARRLFSGMPTRTHIDLQDTRATLDQVERALVNTNADRATIDGFMARMAGAESNLARRQVWFDMMGDIADRAASEYGIDKARAREITRLFDNNHRDIRKYFVDAAGDDVNVLGTMVDGQLQKTPTPHLSVELLDRWMPVADPRTLRREFSDPVTKAIIQNNNGDLRVPLSTMIALQERLWKPTALLRGAYTVRVLGEEQLRISAAGFNAMSNHPMPYLAFLVGDSPRVQRMLEKWGSKLPAGATGRGMYGLPTQGDEIFGGLLHESDQFGKTMFSGGAVFDNEIKLSNYITFQRGETGYLDAAADEIATLAADPVAQMVVREAGGFPHTPTSIIDDIPPSAAGVVDDVPPTAPTSPAGLAGAAPSTRSPLSPLDSPRTRMTKPGHVTSAHTYTDTMYRQGGVAEAEDILLGRGGGIGGINYHLTNDPDIALAQGDDARVFIEFDVTDPEFSVKLNTSKPGWEQRYEEGSAEFLTRGVQGSTIRDAVKSVTVRDLGDDVVDRGFKNRVIPDLRRDGWDEIHNADGSTTFYRPRTDAGGGGGGDIIDTRLVGEGAPDRPPVPPPYVPKNPLQAAQDRFWNEFGFLREQMATSNPDAYLDLMTRQGADEYIRTVLRRINIKAGMREDGTPANPEILHMIATGRIRTPDGNVPLFQPGTPFINKDAVKALEPFTDVFPDVVRGPQTIRLRTGGRANFEALSRGVDQAFGYLATKPANYLSRSPVFSQSYVDEVMALAPKLDPADKAKLLQWAEVNNLTKADRTRLSAVLGSAAGDSPLPMGAVDELAKGRALEHTKGLLYDLADRNQFFDTFRLLFPFGEAWKEMVTTWGSLLKQNPKLPLTAKRVLEAGRNPQAGELVGAPEGQGAFYTNEYGDEVFTYPLSAQAMGLLGLPEVPLTGRLAGLSLMTEVLPGVGPVMQLPLAVLIPDHPAFDGLNNFLFPFGRPDSPRDVGASFALEMMPPWFRTMVSTGFARGGITAEGQRQYANTTMDVMRYLVASGDYQIADNPDSSTELTRLVTDAKEKAAWMTMLRGAAQFGAPSSPMFEWYIDAPDGRKLSMLSLVADYRDMQEEDYATATERFLQKYGDNAFLLMQNKSQSISPGILAPTEAANAWLRENMWAQAEFPVTYGFFAPQGGEFNGDAYQRQLELQERKPLTPEQFVRAGNDLIGKSIYYAEREAMMQQAVAQGRKSLDLEQQAYMRDLDGWLRTNYEGYGDEAGKLGRASPEEMIDELGRAANDDRLKTTPMAVSVREYLAERDWVRQESRANLTSVNSYQSAASGAEYRQYLEQYALSIIEENPDFASVWERVFRAEISEGLSKDTQGEEE